MACILVIDDDRAVRATIKTWLEIEDHEVVVAKDGRDGFKKIETEHFDLLIVDIFMPVMDGLEMIRLVHQRKPELPIIVISGFTVRSSSVSAPDFLAMATKLGGACSRKRGKSRGSGMILRFPRGRESDSFWGCRRLMTSMVFRTSS